MRRFTAPKVMGIININNESFYAGSRCLSTQEVTAKIDLMLSQGVDIIDIGACSTRPGSTSISAEQEWEYLKKPLELIAKEYVSSGVIHPDNISIDTFNSEVVKRVYDTIGKFIVNDISAGEDDPLMLKTVGELDLTYIAMHKRGKPDTMQQLCHYPNGVVNEVIEYFKQFHIKAQKHGIKEYIIDPGYGFAKTTEQNYQLIQGIPMLKKELTQNGEEPLLLIGISRKRMIWDYLNITPDEALCATAAVNLQALLLGGDIIRVHNVKEGVQCVKLKAALSL